MINTFYENNTLNDVIIFTSNCKCYDDIGNNNNIINVNDVIEYKNYLENIMNEHINVKDENNYKKQTLVIFDDIIDEGITKTIKLFMLNIHKLNINFIYSIQFPFQHSPQKKFSFDYVLFFNDCFKPNIKIMYDNYFKEKQIFSNFENNVSKLNDYECLIIEKNTHELFTYKSNYECFEPSLNLMILHKTVFW